MPVVANAPGEELLADFGVPRDRIPPATQIRGGYLLSSLRAIRAAGHGDAYQAALRADRRATIAAISAGEWYPFDLAIDHYAACEALGLPTSEIMEIGAASMRHAYGSWVGVVAKLSTGVGVTPHSLMAQGPKQWGRVFVGSAVAVWKTGPKEARVEIVGLGFSRFRYVRTGLRGILLGAVEGLCKKAYVYDVPELCTPTALGYRVAWV